MQLEFIILFWFQVARHIAGDKALVVVADDNDVFSLLLHFRHAGAINAGNVYMESPLKGRAIIDIDATVQQNLSIIPALLVAHALSGCDTVASYYGIGKGIVLKVLLAGKKHYLHHALNRTIVPYITCPPAPFHFHELLYATEDITFFSMYITEI